MTLASHDIDLHWEPSPERGFLPRKDPLQGLSTTTYDEIEALASTLPILLHTKALRKELGNLSVIDIDPNLSGQELDYLMMRYAYLASAFVHLRGEETQKNIPAGVAVPLVQLSDILDRPPILSYWAYCMNNFRQVDPNGPLSYDNLALLQNFEDMNGDEDGFILIHTDIEGRGGSKVVDGLLECEKQVSPHLENGLEKIADGLNRMNRTMARMPEACSKERYADIVRPYIFGFENVIFQGIEKFGQRPVSFRGETGAQSSIVPAIDEGLDLRHSPTILTQHLSDMRHYMPRRHRTFLERMDKMGPELRAHVTKGPADLRRIYNDCIRELLAFNETHYRYAMEYVKAKVPGNPLGTGGTPYEKWLWQLQEERRTHLL